MKVYGTSCTTNNSTENGLMVEFFGGGRMNREIWIDNLQVFIDIFNLQGLDECNRVETRTYLCGDGNVPVPVQRKAV